MDGEEFLDRVLPYVPWLIAAILAVILAFDSFYTVEPNERAVVLRFGKYAQTTEPGLHFKLPLADSVILVDISEKSVRLPYGVQEATGGDAARARLDIDTSRRVAMTDDEEPTLMLTGDLNTVSVEWTIVWKITVPELFVKRFPDPRSADSFDVQELINAVAKTAMNRLVGDYSFSEVIQEERLAVGTAAREDIQKLLDEYESGIQITNLQLQRAVPPRVVKPAFDDVLASSQEKERLESEGRAQRNKLIPEARAEKDQLIRSAEGYAARRRAEANGEIDALRAQSDAYKQAPEVTRRRLYLEAMQEMLQKVGGKTILDSGSQQVIPLLPLESGGAGNTNQSLIPSGGARR